MKKMLFICLTLLLASCQEPYEKAIDKYYQSHLKDAGSYEVVSTSNTPQKLTPTSYIVFQYENSGKVLLEKLETFRAYCKKQGKDPNEFIGYYVEHEYRAKNSFGAKITHKDRIYFDKELKQIINVERIK